jgi:hypothetical protein
MAPFHNSTIFEHAPVVIDIDAVREAGLLIVPDVYSGLYVLRFDDSNPRVATLQPACWPLTPSRQAI